MIDSKLTRQEFLKRAAYGIGATTMTGAMTGAMALAAPEPTTSDTPAANDARYDLREFIAWAHDTFEPSIKLPGGAGHYARKPGEAIELYGVSDMACVLYTLGRLDPNEKDRAEWADAFQTFQQPDTGWLVEKTPSHTPLHNTAFALAAMNLLDLVPKNPVHLGPEYDDIKTYLGTLNWKTGVYPDSHKGAGVAAIRALLAEFKNRAWFDAYFSACDALVDPNNGLLGQAKPPGGDFDQIGGTFHYFFLYNHFNRHMPHPEKRIDTIINLQRPDGHWDKSNQTWLTLDAIYLLTRTLRYSPHRVDEVHATIHRTMAALMRDLYSPAARSKAFGGKLPAHTLTCAVSILAELQQFWGADCVITDWPLKLVLDRRPFI